MSEVVNKRQIAEVIMGRLNGGKANRDSKVTIRDAMFAIDEARNKLIRDMFNEAYREHGEWDMTFEVLQEYYVTSKYDDKKKIWYVELPVSVIDLYEGRGVYHVSRTGEEYNDFVPQKSGSVSLFHGLEANNIEGQKGYIPRGNILELRGTDKEDDILLRLIPNSHHIGDWESYALPGSLEQMVVRMAMEELSPQANIPADENNDNIQLNQQ
jgi:hypothetical protein